MFIARINFITTILALLLTSPVSVFGAGHSVSPLIIDLDLEKRDIIYKEITVTNQSGGQIRIYPSVNEISVDEEGKIQSFVEPSMVDDRSAAVTSWIEVPRTRIEIKPGESVIVPVTFRINPEVQAGDYHAIIGFGDGSNRPEAEAKVMNGVAPSTVVRISIDEVQNQFLRLDRFIVERFVTNSQEGNIRYSLKNPGSDPVTPAGEIIFYDNNGSEVYSIPVNPEHKTVEPEGTIQVSDRVPTELGMGKYKAFLSVEYGEHLTASVHDTAFFYVLPLKPLIITFAIVLVLSILIALYVHRRYDTVEDNVDGMLADVPLYIRTQRSESKDHDIDLSNKKS